MPVRWRCRWLAWVVGGYFASLLLYNCVDGLSRALLPPPPPGLTRLDAAPLTDGGGSSSVTARLLHPEGDDRLAALLLGSLAPCASAPIFEEVLYRGFLLPALTRFVPLRLALPLHALVFGLHHRTLAALRPVSALGLLWGVLYVRSANLLVPILIHAMWNSRIFLSSSIFGRV